MSPTRDGDVGDPEERCSTMPMMPTMVMDYAVAVSAVRCGLVLGDCLLAPSLRAADAPLNFNRDVRPLL